MIRFGAVGDTAFHNHTAEEMLAKGVDWPFEKMQEHLDRADVLFGNLECPFLPDDFPEEEIDPRAMLCNVSASEGAGALKRAGFDFLCLANNHVLDLGSRGLDYTREVLAAEGFQSGGVGDSQEEARQMVTMEKGGITLGFLCYAEDNNYSLGHTNPGPAYYTLDAVREDVAAARGKVDVVIVSIHADIEFMPTPSVPRLEISRKIAESGAHVILEHHPHVPQGVEMVNGCLIAYSLGNFVFNVHTDDYMRNNGPHTGHSFFLLADLSPDGVQSFERVPFTIPEPPEQRPTPLEGAEQEEMLRYLADLDAMLQDAEFVKNTWRETAMRMLRSYLSRLPNYEAEDLIEQFVGRLCLVAENRSWMEEVLAMGREAWEKQQQERDPYHRPHYRFTRE